MYLILALFLQATSAGPQDMRLTEAHRLLEQRIGNVEGGLLLLESVLRKLPEQFTTPTTGMVVVSPEGTDADGLHRLVVRSVFTDGPAGRDGIMPGDRIMAIGPRRLEHETVPVFHILVDADVGPIELVVRRDGTERTVVVHREISDCLERTRHHMNIPLWQEKIVLLRRACASFRSTLALPESRTLSELIRLNTLYRELHEEFVGTMDRIQQHMNDLRRVSCKERFE
jgi:C-terminal processing protease CtpA/Prc